MDIIRELENLENINENNKIFSLPETIKPCISAIFNQNQSEIEIRGEIPFIIACELKRTGKDNKYIEKKLSALFVMPSKIRSALKSLDNKDYTYGCPKLRLKGICLYEKNDECYWYRQIPKKSYYRYKERDFWRYKWSKILSPAQTLTYLSLIEIEKLRGFNAGSKLYLSRVQIAGIVNISEPYVIECLTELSRSGLIDFKKGTQHLHYGKASEVKRIIPIPSPDKSLLEK